MTRMPWQAVRPLWSAVVALSLGIAVWLLSLALLETSVLRPLPFHMPDHLVYVTEIPAGEPQPVEGTSEAALALWSERATTVTRVAAWEDRAETRQWLLTTGSDVEYIRGTTVTPEFFEALGTLPSLGRTFLTRSDYKTRFPPEVVISDGLWRRRFGSRSDIIGQTIEFQRWSKPTVVGVMPPGFNFPPGTDVWGVAVPRQPPHWTSRTQRMYKAFARMRGGVSHDDVAAELGGILAQDEPRTTTSSPQWGVQVSTLHDWMLGEHKIFVRLLHVAGLCVLLLAFANASHVMLAHELAARRHTAIRLALGADARDLLVTKIATVSIVAAVSSATALAICAGIVRAITHSSLLPDLPRAHAISVTGPVIAAAVVVPQILALMTAGLTVRRVRVHELTPMLVGTGRIVTYAHSRAVRRILTASQVAVTVVALSGCFLLAKAWYIASSNNPGFVVSRLAAIDIRLPVLAYGDTPWPRLVSLYSSVLDVARQSPGVDSAAVVSDFPLSGDAVAQDLSGSGIGGRTIQSVVHVVGGEYWAVMGIPVIAGRTFSTTETMGPPDIVRGQASRTIGVAVISEVSARALFGSESAVGRRVRLQVMGTPREFDVVGVVGSVKVDDVRRAPRPEIYLPLRESPGFSASVVVRLSETSALPIVRERLQRLEPRLMIPRMETAEAVVARSIQDLTVASGTLAALGVGMVILTLIALWSTCQIAVGDRKNEITVRRILGAPPGRLFLTVLAEPLTTLSAGVLLGAAFATALRQAASGVTPEAAGLGGTVEATALILASGVIIAAWHTLRATTSPLGTNG